MDQGEIEAYIRQSRELIDASPEMDEANTKVRLVQPFLELLGWNFRSTEVALEYTIPMASGQTHVDYALLVGDSPAVFVEAKPLRSELGDPDVQQLKSYMRQELDVDWGILSNGASFEVLTKDRDHNGGEEVSVVQFDLDDLAANPEVLELLTKESIRSGKSDEIAEQIARTNRAIRDLQQCEDTVARSVAEAVEGEVGELTLDLDEQAREFVRSLVSLLRDQRQFVGDVETAASGGREIGTETNDDTIDVRESRMAGTMARSNIEGDPEARVAVFPTRESGLTFLRENEAWGFVKVASDFKYVAMYVTGDVGAVKYVAKVQNVVEPDEADLVRPPSKYVDRAKLGEHKKVVEFEPGTLYELEDPVPLASQYPQSLRYTTLGALREAETTDDLFG